MEEEKSKVIDNVSLENAGTNSLKKAKEINESIKNHLTPEYRKQFNIRRFFSCFLLFIFIRSWEPSYGSFIDTIFSLDSTYALAYSFLAWKFWHYAFWSFKGGFIDSLSNSLIYMGSIWAVIGKIFLQNFIILIWIALIAPFSGIKTWRKAMKHDKYLYIENEKNDVWN